MKLELKHLAGYLPYELECKTTHSKYKDNYKLIGIDFSGCIFKSFELFYFKIKPILKPLLDLTKEIEVNGEKFVPIIELLKLEYHTQDKIGKYSEISVNKEGYPSAYFTYQPNRCLTVYTSNINGTDFWIVQKLLEWHFDIYGLIENGLAISIHDVEEAGI